MIWYVSYGSNMLRERFLTYIEGGQYRGGGAPHDACADTTPPQDVRTFDIPHDMYFGNQSGSWNGAGVSFLDTSKPGHALGVAYLITEEQFEHVAAQENGGTAPEYSTNWYNAVICLGEWEGHDVWTISNTEIRPYHDPDESYLNTLRQGLKENYPTMTSEEIDQYLQGCIREE